MASGLVFAVGMSLFLLTEQTDRYFAWTIDVALTAAFLGAAYWPACVLEFMAARRRLWADARVAVPAVIIFLTAWTMMEHNRRNTRATMRNFVRIIELVCVHPFVVGLPLIAPVPS